MFEIPEDLSELSAEELAELAERAAQVTAEIVARGADVTDDELAELEALASGVERVRAAQTARETEAAERQARLDEYAGRILPTADAGDGDDGAGGEGGDGAGEGEGEGEGAGSDGAGAEPTAEVPEPVAAAATATRPSTRRRAAAAAVAPLGGQGGGVATLDRPATPAPIRPPSTIVAGADIPGIDSGSTLQSVRGISRALIARREHIGRPGRIGSPEDVIVASVHAEFPAERQLGAGSDRQNEQRIAAVASREAVLAAGGLCTPVTPYYEIMVLAGADRPVRDSLAGFQADRGGLRLVPPPTTRAAATTARTVSDGVTTNASATITSATAAFKAIDQGAAVSGTGIPAGAFIVSVTNGTTAVLSANATADGTGISITINRLGATTLITLAQDAAALNGTAAQIVAGTKPCLHVTCPAPVEFDLYAISRCLEFGNFTTRAYPEQVDAWVALAMSEWARRGETALLDGISTNSTQVTAAKTVGAARQLIAQITKAAAYYRNRNRMPPEITLRCMLPAWVIDLAVADLTHGSGFELEFFTQARQSFLAALGEVNVRPAFYLDSGTGKGQYINAGAIQGAGALTAFPSTCVWYLFSEGSFLFLDGGSLDFGIVRDSSLNSLNNYRMFAETFEQVAFVGVESLEVTSTVVADGSASGTVTPPSSF